MQSVPTIEGRTQVSAVRAFPGAPAVEFASLFFEQVAHRRSVRYLELAAPKLWQDGRVAYGVDTVDQLRHRLVIAPGVLQLATSRLPSDHEDQGDDEGLVELGPADPEAGLDYCGDEGTHTVPKPKGAIVGFSEQARRNMIRTIAALDWSQLVGVPAMVTLTYPGDWRAVCPDGRTVKRHLEAFKSRWARKFGRPIQGIWKLEFQRRGAPHLHLYVGRPSSMELVDFRAWVADAWVEIVGAVGEERRRHRLAGTGVDQQGAGWEASAAVDIRRLARYFAKHNAKGVGHYQHTVPDDFEGVGRFWGFWGLDRAAHEVELSTADFVELRRVLHRARRARLRSLPFVDVGRPEHRERHWQVDRATGVVQVVEVVRRRKRKVRRRIDPACPGRLNGLSALTVDGPAMATQLGRWLATSGL